MTMMPLSTPWMTGWKYSTGGGTERGAPHWRVNCDVEWAQNLWRRRPRGHLRSHEREVYSSPDEGEREGHNDNASQAY